MLKSKAVKSIIVVLCLLGALVGGYSARPWVDFWLADQPVAQEHIASTLVSYALIAERLSAYSEMHQGVRDVVNYYQDIGTNLDDAEVAAIMLVDPRYQIVKDVEEACPGIYVVTVEHLQSESGYNLIAVWLLATPSELSAEERGAIQEKAFGIAAESAIRNMGLSQSSYLLIMWCDTIDIEGIGGKVTVASASVGAWAPVDVWNKWIAGEKTYDSLSEFTDSGEMAIYISFFYGPMYPNEYLPRLSTEQLPWNE